MNELLLAIPYSLKMIDFRTDTKNNWLASCYEGKHNHVYVYLLTQYMCELDAIFYL